MIISYNNSAVSIKNRPHPEAKKTDLEDLITAIGDKSSERMYTPLEGVEDALQDSDYLDSIDANQEVVNFLYRAVI
jgi:hypothetical protein